MPSWVELLNLGAKVLFIVALVVLVIIIAWSVWKVLSGGTPK